MCYVSERVRKLRRSQSKHRYHSARHWVNPIMIFNSEPPHAHTSSGSENHAVVLKLQDRTTVIVLASEKVQGDHHTRLFDDMVPS